MKSRMWLVGSLIATTLFWVCQSNSNEANAEWPQWRGPNRDGISAEKGLLKTWPEGGPKVLWRVQAGEGFSGISVSRGRAYTMFAVGDDEFVVCLDAFSGKELWRFRSGSKFVESHGNGPRSTPTVDGDRVFVMGTKGTLHALDAGTGKKYWERDFVQEFGSKVPTWGFSTSPLVEGELLLVEVGGEEGKSLVAFDKKSGDVVWTSHTDKPAYSSPIAIVAAGMRQIVFFTAGGPVSVSPADGRLFWSYPWKTSYDVNAATPVFIAPDKVFISSGYDKGAAVLQIKEAQGRLKVEEIWRSRVMKNHFNSSVLHTGYLYGFDNAILTCIAANTGEKKWETRGFEKGSLMLADGHLIVLGEKGKLALVEVSPAEYREKASAQVLEGKCWTVPTLAGGKLYVRNEKELVCLDLSGKI